MAEHKMKKEIRELEKRFEEEKAENKELKKRFEEEKAENKELKKRFEEEKAENKELKKRFEEEKAENKELKKRFEEEKAENKELKKSLDEMSYALEENIKKTEEEKRRKEEEIGDERNRREEELGKKLMEISELEERLCAEKNGKSKLKEELRLEREEKTRHRDRAMHKQREADDLNKEMENMSQRIAHLTEFKQRCVDILTGEAVDSTAVSEFTQMVAGDHYQMHVAVSLGVPWIVEEVRRNNTSLLKNKNKRGWTPFCLATARGDTRIMDQLWQSKKDLHMDPPLLHVAAMNCQHRAAKFLKGHVNKRTTYKGATASQVARLMAPLSRHTQRNQQELDDLWNHASSCIIIHAHIIITSSTIQVIFAESLEVLVMALEALYEEAKPLGIED
ncbi:hypothetical protein GWK47_044037 [Chionoecetes opilio]|uniref:Uncharacterized protein n=1 Tax=Chionoecetes opilio TaxID=41210 RepID=A0A8J4YGZ7_CHIOP|nr:hypothetical protein GWK47_044037 [Chionoecetes opilio]